MALMKVRRIVQCASLAIILVGATEPSISSSDVALGRFGCAPSYCDPDPFCSVWECGTLAHYCTFGKECEEYEEYCRFEYFCMELTCTPDDHLLSESGYQTYYYSCYLVPL